MALSGRDRYETPFQTDVMLGRHLFQPPPASCASSTSAISQQSASTRKRLRQGPTRERRSLGAADADHVLRMSSYGEVTPTPLANSAYELAGGFDTPTLAATRVLLDQLPEHRDDVLDFQIGDQDASITAQGPLARERNGQGRPGFSFATDDAGWSSFVLHLVGGVVGEVWDFCRNSAFRGFHAGGGQGYGHHAFSVSNSNPCDPYPRPLTPVPGQYPLEALLSDTEQDTRRVHASKRLHTNPDSWVLVGHDLNTHDASPRLSTRKTSTPSRILSPSIASRQPITRRSLIPTSRRASTASTRSPHTARSKQVSPTRRLTSTRPSLGPMNVMTATTISNCNRSSSPLPAPSPETALFLQRQERRDRVADKSMRKMSRQVQDLIRQGQEALGTRVEVREGGDDDDDDDDEGFGEGEGWEELGESLW